MKVVVRVRNAIITHYVFLSFAATTTSLYTVRISCIPHLSHRSYYLPDFWRHLLLQCHIPSRTTAAPHGTSACLSATSSPISSSDSCSPFSLPQSSCTHDYPDQRPIQVIQTVETRGRQRRTSRWRQFSL